MNIREHQEVRDRNAVLERNKVKQLNFSSPHIDVRFVKNVTDFAIEGRTVVINPHLSHVDIDEPPGNSIPPWSSTILKGTRIRQADSLILLEVREATNIGNIILESGWNLYGDLVGNAPVNAGELPYPKNTPLWRSPQDSVGLIELKPGSVPSQTPPSQAQGTFQIKVNLWFAPAQTNCFIHNKHDFIEIHSQICGNGRMQKFKAQDYATLYEDMLMSPGYTTPVPFCRVQANQQFIYPWHQYYADTDCIWLAIEYHPYISGNVPA